MVQPGYSAGRLRDELVVRGKALAKRDGLVYEMSSGTRPSMIFGIDES